MRADLLTKEHVQKAKDEDLYVIQVMVSGQYRPFAVNARKTHCVRGHPFNEANTRVSVNNGKPVRQCRQCCKDRQKAKRRRQAGVEL